MRYVWCVNEIPDYVKGDKNGIDGYFLGGFDPQATRATVADVLNKGHAVGLYFASNWSQFNGLDASGIGRTVVQKYNDIGVKGLRLQMDMEEKQPDKIADVLAFIRGALPAVGLSWTMEGHQGGWMSPSFVARIMLAKVRVVPQCYNAEMTKVWDTLAMARNLTRVGFPDSIISPFYDAAKLPEWWQGYAFEQRRLPA